MTQKSLEGKINRKFFRQNPKTVARKLLGRELVRIFPNNSEVRGRILEVSAWQGISGDNIDQKFPEYKPGVVSVSPRRGWYLTDITCGNGNACVTLVSAEYDFEGELVKVGSPGKLSEALGINPDGFDGYDLISGNSLRVEGSPVNPKLVMQRQKSNLPANCRGFFYVR